MIAFSAWRNKNTRWLMRLLQARCGINCYVQIDKFHEAFHVMCIVSHTELQDKHRKHGLWEMKWERQPHDILVSDLFMSHWKMLRDHDEGCGIMNQNGIGQKQFLPNEVMKISHCGPVLHLVMCVNSADSECRRLGIHGKRMVIHVILSVLGPLETQRLLKKSRWLSLDVAVPLVPLKTLSSLWRA